MTFICNECKAGAHDKCPGGTWCNCLHRRVTVTNPLLTIRVSPT